MSREITKKLFETNVPVEVHINNQVLHILPDGRYAEEVVQTTAPAVPQYSPDMEEKKATLAAIMSHEMSNPVSAIQQTNVAFNPETATIDEYVDYLSSKYRLAPEDSERLLYHYYKLQKEYEIKLQEQSNQQSIGQGRTF